ncbi:MAG: class I SAM-dependent rRNA methyltransferase [Verrucomicrobia bacterium]|nr:class I SAM-dependent rRNA methyltransferase [Verrucomicrobiota bacterium]
MPGLIIRPRSRILHGHDWVYGSEVLKVFGEPADGDVVSLKDPKDKLLGSAIYNSRSTIVARRFSRQRQELDADFIQRRLEQALKYRREQLGLAAGTPQRLVWSESDGLPGVIVDAFGDVLVLQTNTLAMDRAKPLIVEALVRQLAPACVVERNDSSGRRAEGLPEQNGILHGTLPEEVWIELNGLSFLTDPAGGQKTGFYLDQRSNHAAVAAHAAGRRVLDCFTHSGAFALHAARAGAASVTGVEISAGAVGLCRRNAERNGLSDRVVWQTASAFDFLAGEEKRGSSYDLIVLDPPSFAKAKGAMHDALRGYRDLHIRALKLLAPGGLLATFSCSHHLSDTLFREMVSEASFEAKRAVRLRETYRQAPDHPVLLWMPETEYLRGFLFELLPGR